MEQQPASGPSTSGRGSFQSRQQTDGTEQQSPSGSRDRALGSSQSEQEMEGTQQPQGPASGPKDREHEFLETKEQAEETQRPQLTLQMKREQLLQKVQQKQVPGQVGAQPQDVYTSQPTGGEASKSQQVEQVTAMMGSMTTAGVVPRGRGIGRGRGILDAVRYNRVLRRESSVDRREDMITIGRGDGRGGRILDTVRYNRVLRPEPSEDRKHGTLGKPVELIANYFPIMSNTNWSVYEYAITFHPEENNISVRRELLSNHKEFLGPNIFDGNSMFGIKKFDFDFKLTSNRTTDNEIIIMTIKFVNKIETNNYVNIDMLNLLLHDCCKGLELNQDGKHYFDALAKIKLSKHKLELWPGYEANIGLFDNGLLLHAEISTIVVRQETALDFLNECIADIDRRKDVLTKFKHGIIGKVVITRYNNEICRIDDVDGSSDINTEFKMNDGTMMCLKEYYDKKCYCKSVYDGWQPLLVSKRHKSYIYGGNDEVETMYLVPEFCNLTGISDSMRNNYNLMRDLTQCTRLNPEERISRYCNFARRIQSESECLVTLNNWNLTLDNELIKVPARVLPIEKIRSNNSQYDGGYIGDWSQHTRSLPMYITVVMKRWLILTPNLQNINAFISNIQKAGHNMSFSIPRPDIIEFNGLTARDYFIYLERILNTSDPSFILCVVTTKRNDIYNVIKRKLCVDRAVPSHIVLVKHVQKNEMLFCGKIAIQMNCKLGGIPWSVNIPVKGLMVVGFDVCVDIYNKRISYGALVASLNDTHTSYFNRVEQHRSDIELSTNFSISMAKALDRYRSKNGELPKSIVIYRDGVTDEQSSRTYVAEIANIKKMFKEFYEQEPPFAFILVKQSSSSRFFVASSQYAIPENPLPGTVIDRVVTDPHAYDFFLVSHYTRYGTMTPTYYNIIEDTLVNWSPDKMQRLTYKLTHMYYNWSGTVKVPAHCKMANKLASLSAKALRTSPNINLSESLFFL